MELLAGRLSADDNVPGTQKSELDIDWEDSRIVSKILNVTSEKEKHMENAVNCPCNRHLLFLNSKKVTMMGFHSLGTELGVYFFYSGLICQFPN